jgi:hypothetical protein
MTYTLRVPNGTTSVALTTQPAIDAGSRRRVLTLIFVAKQSAESGR